LYQEIKKELWIVLYYDCRSDETYLFYNFEDANLKFQELSQKFESNDRLNEDGRKEYHYYPYEDSYEDSKHIILKKIYVF
jgi:hypothetical protein